MDATQRGGYHIKTADKKEKYVVLRAEGLSYSKIAAELEISKSTCVKWERDLSEQLQIAKDERMRDLYTLYRMGKEARITKLGETLSRIDEAIDEADLSTIPADKLLRLKLEYEDRLQAEYSDPDGYTLGDNTSDEIITALVCLYERIRAGTVTADQAKAERDALGDLRRAVADKENAW